MKPEAYASSYFPLGAAAVVEVIGEDAPVIRIHFPSFVLYATCSCDPRKASCLTSLGARGSLTSITSPLAPPISIRSPTR